MSSIIKTLKSAEPTDLPSRMWLSDLYYTHKAWTTWANKSSAHGRMYLFRLVAVCKSSSAENRCSEAPFLTYR